MLLAVARLRILSIEHEDQVRKALRGQLAEHDLYEATSLASARAAHSERSFDVILAGFSLPDGTSEGLLRALARAGDRACRLLQAHAEPPEAARLREDGVIAGFFRRRSWAELTRFLAQLRPRPANPPRRASVEKRVESRVDMDLPAHVHCDSWRMARRLHTIDLSASGLGLWAREPAPPDAPIRIALTLPDGECLRLKGGVRYSAMVADDDGGMTWKIGVKLEDPGVSARLVLLTLLYGEDGTGGPERMC